MAFNRRLVFSAACVGMLIFGVVMTTLGAILPSVMDDFGVAKTEAGSLFLLLSLGILAGSLFFGPIVDRYGYKGLLIACTAIIAAGLEGIAFAGSFDILRASVFLVGLGGGVINGGTNALAADVSVEGRSAGLSLLGVFFGIGAFSVPFALGFLLEHYSYSPLIGATGALVLLCVLYFAVLRFPAPKHAQGFPIKEGARLIREPVLLLFGFMLFIQSGLEITTGGWTATYVNEELGQPEENAVFFLSLFWIGITAARLFLGSILKRKSPALILRAFIGVACLGSVLLIVSSNLWVAGIGILLLGAGLAAGFPIVLGYTGDRYPHLTGTAFSILFVIALTGGSIVPFVTGILGDAVGLRLSFLALPAGLLLMLVLLSLVLRQLRVAPAEGVEADIPH